MKSFFILVTHEEQDSIPYDHDLMINPWGLESELFHYQIVEQQQSHPYDVSIMYNDAWEVHLSHLSGIINKKFRSLIRADLASGEVTCSPLGSLSWSLDYSTYWVSVYMLELNNPKGKFLSCISEVSSCTTHISHEQWLEHLCFVYDAPNIYGGRWDHHKCLENINDVCFNAIFHMESHIWKLLI